MNILHQLSLALVALTLMVLCAAAGVAGGIFVVAYAGGHAISQYDPGATKATDAQRAPAA